MRLSLPLILSVLATHALVHAHDPTEDVTVSAFRVLAADHQAATKKFYADFQEARKKNPALPYRFDAHPDRKWGEKYAEFAKNHPDTEGGAMALAQVVRLDRGKPRAAKALDTLLTSHIKSRALKDVVWSLRGWPVDGAAKLAQIVAGSPHREVQGSALFVLAQSKKSSDLDGAVALFKKVIADYPDVAYWGRSTLGAKAEGEIFAAKNLQVGKPVPEIVGEDIDGVPMKLSDFRGKVVFLDFWGDW